MGDRCKQSRAFTLLELLAATAMTAVLAGSLYATLRIAFQARRTAIATVEQVRKTELAFELLRTDIESAVVPTGILAGVFLGEDAVGTSGQASDVLVLHCTADGAQDTEGIGDIRMVEFSCEKDPQDEGMVLLRRITVHLLATRVEEGQEEALCRGVRSFNVRYFDGLDWRDAWDSGAQDNALPLAVEITLELMGEDDTDADAAGYRASRVFQVPCSSMTAGRQVGAISP